MDPIQSLPPDQMILQIILSSQLSRVVAVAEELGLADHLAEGPKTASELAALTGTLDDPLYRMLRLLASVGIFEEQAGRSFANTAASRLLGGEPGGFPRALVRWINCAPSVDAWQRLDHSLRTGTPAFDAVHGADCFTYFSNRPEQAAMVNAAMSSVTVPIGAAIAAGYDFAGVRTIIDIGGGNGALLAAIVGAHPHLRGIVFDLPGAIAAAEKDRFSASGLEFRSGSFFDAVPEGADLYLMKHVVHDWDDGPALRLLRNCRDAMGDAARLLVVEHVLTDGPESIPAKLLDIETLVMSGGRQRTADEFQRLFEAAGFSVRRTVPLFGTLSAIEASPAAR